MKNSNSIEKLLGKLLYNTEKSISSVAREDGYTVTPLLQILSEYGFLERTLVGKKNNWSITEKLSIETLKNKQLLDDICKEYKKRAADYNKAFTNTKNGKSVEKSVEKSEEGHQYKMYNLTQMRDDIAAQTAAVNKLLANTEIIVAQNAKLLQSLGIDKA